MDLHPIFLLSQFHFKEVTIPLNASELRSILPLLFKALIFLFREIRNNSVLDYNEHNITYEQNYSFVFDQSRSCPTCYEDDVIITPNIVASVSTYWLAYLYFFTCILYLYFQGAYDVSVPCTIFSVILIVSGKIFDALIRLKFQTAKIAVHQLVE